MKKLGIIAVLCCTFALCAALVGCGGEPPVDEAAVAKEAFAGSWELMSMSQGDDTTSSDDVQMLAALGMKVTLSLNDDGTAKLVVFDSTMAGTWEAVDATTATAVLDGQSVDMTLDGEQLTLAESGSTMTFKKGAVARSASAASADAAASGEAASGEAASGEATEAEEASSESAA